MKVAHTQEEESTMQTESRSGNQIIGEGLEKIINPDKFREAMHRVSEAAFKAVFQAQDAGSLRWKREGANLTDLATTITIRNGRGDDITIPVIFFEDTTDDGYKYGYLMLGSKRDAPCHNILDLRVKRLYSQVTKKRWLHPDPMSNPM